MKFKAGDRIAVDTVERGRLVRDVRWADPSHVGFARLDDGELSMGLRTYRLWDNTTVWSVLSVEVLPAVNTMSEWYGRFYVHAKGSWRWFRVEKGRWFMWNEITKDGRYVNEEPWVLIEKQR